MSIPTKLWITFRFSLEKTPKKRVKNRGIDFRRYLQENLGFGTCLPLQLSKIEDSK